MVTSMIRLAIESCLCSPKQFTARPIFGQSCLGNGKASREAGGGADLVGVKATPGAGREGAAQVAEADRAVAVVRAIRFNASPLLRSHQCFTVDDKYNLVADTRFSPHQWQVGECAFHAFAIEAHLDDQQTSSV